MDLGATICTPRNPSCLLCPWAAWCEANAAGDQIRYPVKVPKKAQPVRHGHAYVMLNSGRVWLQRRPESGLLGGMMEVPGSDWTGREPDFDPPVTAQWTEAAAPVRHVFTHFELRLRVHTAEVANDLALEGKWVPVEDLSGQALPSLMKKVIKAAGILAG